MKGHLNSFTLRPLINVAWKLSGINCRLLYEPRKMSSSGQVVVDGIRMRRSALQPDFPGAAPPEYERSYHLAAPDRTAGAQPNASEASVQPEETAAVAAGDGSLQAHGRQSPTQPQDAEQLSDSQLQNFMAAMKGVLGTEQVDEGILVESAHDLHRRLLTVGTGRVRIGFMGQGKLEDVFAEAIEGSMVQLWRSRDRIIRSVVRQVWLQVWRVHVCNCLCRWFECLLCTEWLIIRCLRCSASPTW